ncbi:hypothetical protein ACFL59_01620 [Planctomycetota bacterium]
MVIKRRRRRTVFREPWGCPRTKNRTNWCYAFCTPEDGLGECGRPAGHATLGRTQMAILRHREGKRSA